VEFECWKDLSYDIFCNYRFRFRYNIDSSLDREEDRYSSLISALCIGCMRLIAKINPKNRYSKCAEIHCDISFLISYYNKAANCLDFSPPETELF
jgi:hypothetical protein